MINKIIHIGWLGNGNLPQDVVETIKAWMDLNPDYLVKCWYSSESVGKSLEEVLVKNRVESANILKQSHFGNIDLIKECLKNGNPLAAWDTLKIDLMVHEGGLCFDSGVKPTTSLDKSIPKDAIALCDITTVGAFSVQGTKLSVTRRTNGEYHFHASVKGGELYTKAQALHKELLIGLKKLKDPLFGDFSSLLFHQNDELRYQVTKNSTGLTVFLAIDSLLLKYANKMPFLTVFPVSTFGTPKKRMGQRPPMGFFETMSLGLFGQQYMALNERLLAMEAIKSVSPSKAGMFSNRKLITAHEALLQDMEKLDAVPVDVKEAINQKKYALALRRTCHRGFCPAIDVLDRYRKSLNIDYAETSTNGKTAWDWLQASTATDEEKERYRESLGGVAPQAGSSLG